MTSPLRIQARRHLAPGILFAGMLAITFVGSSLFGSSQAQAELDPETQRFVELHNEARSEGRYCGDKYMEAVGPLRWSDELSGAAQMHATDAASNMIRGHTGSDGSTLFERVKRLSSSFFRVGENIAYFTRDMEHSVEQWLDSPGHCANIMNPGFTYMGTGYALGPVFNNPHRSGTYTVVVFGAKFERR